MGKSRLEPETEESKAAEEAEAERKAAEAKARDEEAINRARYREAIKRAQGKRQYVFKKESDLDDKDKNDQPGAILTSGKAKPITDLLEPGIYVVEGDTKGRRLKLTKNDEDGSYSVRILNRGDSRKWGRPEEEDFDLAIAMLERQGATAIRLDWHGDPNNVDFATLQRIAAKVERAGLEVIYPEHLKEKFAPSNKTFLGKTLSTQSQKTLTGQEKRSTKVAEKAEPYFKAAKGQTLERFATEIKNMKRTQTLDELKNAVLKNPDGTELTDEAKLTAIQEQLAANEEKLAKLSEAKGAAVSTYNRLDRLFGTLQENDEENYANLIYLHYENSQSTSKMHGAMDELVPQLKEENELWQQEMRAIEARIDAAAPDAPKQQELVTQIKTSHGKLEAQLGPKDEAGVLMNEMAQVRNAHQRLETRIQQAAEENQAAGIKQRPGFRP